MIGERDTARRELELIRRQLRLSNESNGGIEGLQQLAQQHADLSASHERLQASFREAAAHAERASAAAEAEECRRRVDGLASRMKGEADRMISGDLEPSAQQLQRLLDELRDMSRQQSELDSINAELRAENGKLKKAAGAAGEVSAKDARHAAEVSSLRSQLEAMSDARDAALRAAMASGGAPADPNGMAAAELDRMRAEGEELRRDARRSKESAELALQGQENMQMDRASMSMRINELVESLEGSQHESDAYRHERDALAEQLALIGSHAGNADSAALQRAEDAARAAEMKLRELEPLQAAHDAAVAARDSHLAARTDLEAVHAQIEAVLSEASGIVGGDGGDTRPMGNRVHELARRYVTAEASLAQTSRELAFTAVAMERSQAELRQVGHQADARMAKLQQASQRERHLLVQAAVKSLQQLRTHLTSTLAGLRVNMDEGSAGGAPFAEWRAKYAGQEEPIVLRLKHPDTPPLFVRHVIRPSSARPASQPTTPRLVPAGAAVGRGGAARRNIRPRSVSADADLGSRMQIDVDVAAKDFVVPTHVQPAPPSARAPPPAPDVAPAIAPTVAPTGHAHDVNGLRTRELRVSAPPAERPKSAFAREMQMGGRHAAVEAIAAETIAPAPSPTTWEEVAAPWASASPASWRPAASLAPAHDEHDVVNLGPPRRMVNGMPRASSARTASESAPRDRNT